MGGTSSKTNPTDTLDEGPQKLIDPDLPKGCLDVANHGPMECYLIQNGNFENVRKVPGLEGYQDLTSNLEKDKVEVLKGLEDFGVPDYEVKHLEDRTYK